MMLLLCCGAVLSLSALRCALRVVACVGRAAGVEWGTDALAHAVLRVEQMLTTGGGWQDQIGGVVGGVKACSCAAASLPLSVCTRPLPLSATAIAALEAHLQLVYTGKTRLARNLLQAAVVFVFVFSFIGKAEFLSVSLFIFTLLLPPKLSS